MGLTKVSYAMINGASVNVLDFGAAGDGVTDDTTAIQAAINSLTTGGRVYFPKGSYKITTQLTITVNGITLCGANRWSTEILQSTTNAKIFNITAMFTNVSSLAFRYSSTPVAGATAIYCSGNYCTFTDFVIRNSHIGIYFTNASAGKVTEFEILDYEFSGIFVTLCNDITVSTFIMNAGNTTRGAAGGITLKDQVEAFICTDGDILLGRYSLYTSATSYTAANRPAYNNFTNVFFDSAANQVFLDGIVETEFVGCWFSNGRSGSGAAGCVLYTTDSIVFVACRFFNCGADGCVVNATANSTMFIGCSFESNSVTTGTNASHGLSIAPNTLNFTATNCIASNNLYPGGQQGYGIIVNSGTSSGYSITNNVVSGNGIIGISDGGTGTIKTISGNIGYTTVAQGTATITASTSVTVTHGLSVAPTAADISVTPLSTIGDYSLWVDTITSTTFKINTSGTVTADFAFQARTKGA